MPQIGVKPHLRPLSRQTIGSTGATCGIGLATARLAAGKGAKLVLVARNENALRDLAEAIRGGKAEHVVADVADRAALEGAARRQTSLLLEAQLHPVATAAALTRGALAAGRLGLYDPRSISRPRRMGRAARRVGQDAQRRLHRWV